MGQGRRTAILALSGMGVSLLLACLWFLSLPIRAQSPIKLAASKARSSAVVTQLIGQPLNSGRFVKGYLVANDGNGSGDRTIRLQGPLRYGLLLEWAQEDKGKWHICSLLFRS